MNNSKSTLVSVVLAFVCLFLIISSLTVWVSKRDQSEHLKTVIRCNRILLPNLNYFSESRLLAVALSDSENSWRPKFVALSPFPLEPRNQPDLNIPWQSKSWDEWDNAYNPIFCLKNLSSLPRNERFTRIMAIQGEGSAFEFMKRKGLEELIRLAPDTIFVVEVINSKVPWMQVGDLHMGKFPSEINHSKRLAIGSVHGYNKFVVGFADASIWVVDASVPFLELEKFLTVEKAMKYSREKDLAPYGAEVEFKEFE